MLHISFIEYHFNKHCTAVQYVSTKITKSLSIFQTRFCMVQRGYVQIHPCFFGMAGHVGHVSLVSPGSRSLTERCLNNESLRILVKPIWVELSRIRILNVTEITPVVGIVGYTMCILCRKTWNHLEPKRPLFLLWMVMVMSEACGHFCGRFHRSCCGAKLPKP